MRSFPGSGAIIAQIGPSGVVVTTSGSSGTARPLDRTSLFEIGSVTKTFTATILASMVLDGSVKLDDPIAKYLPATVHVPVRNGKQITLGNLATQRSGLPRLPSNFGDVARPDPYARYTVADMYAFLSHYKLPRDPGATFEYSNLGIGLLGQVLADRARVSYADLLRGRVLRPLDMKDTTLSLTAIQMPRFTVGRNEDNERVAPWTFDAIAPAGALHSSIDDMLKFARCNMGEGPLAKSCLFAQKPRSDFSGNRIGLVWMTDDDRHFVYHGGDTAGYHAAVAISPDHTHAVVALGDGGTSMEAVAFHALDAKIPIMHFPRTIAVDAATLDAYVGTYVSKSLGMTFVVTHEGKAVRVRPTGQENTRIFPIAPDAFVSHLIDVRFTFVRDDVGKPVGLKVIQDGQTATFLRAGGKPPATAHARQNHGNVSTNARH